MRLFERVAELENERVPFALAIVVSRRSPVSSHVGDRALVFADGRMEGFVGGSCSRDLVRRHGVAVIRDGTPRLLRIRPEPAPDVSSDGHAGQPIFVAMSCASEGAADVYLEPHLPAPRLIIVGNTPIALALARLAAAVDYDVLQVVDEAEIDDLSEPRNVATIGILGSFVTGLSPTEAARTTAVVASLGQYDETALAALLERELRFIGLVASRKRAARVLEVLEQQGCSSERLAAVRSPVGLDLGARTSGDVAVSILAEIVAVSSRAASLESEDASAPASPVARDPICGMDVEIEGARQRFDLDGRTYYFCGAGCRAAFEADPASALAAAGSS